MSLDNLKKQLQPLVAPLETEIVSIIWDKHNGQRVLQLAIKSANGVDVDLCAAVSNAVEITVDEFVEDDEQFYLEVTSLGAEQPFTSYEELCTEIGAHIYAKLVNPVANFSEIIGDLIEADETGKVTIAYRDKTRTKNLEIEYENINFIRRAVKF